MFCGVRLRTLELPSLVQRRLRGNLTALCSSLRRKSRRRCRTLLPVNKACRNSTKLHQQRLTLNVRKNFFTMRVVRDWNGFPIDEPSLYVLRGIWTMLSIVCLALKRSGSWIRWSLKVLSYPLSYSVLFYLMLIYRNSFPSFHVFGLFFLFNWIRYWIKLHPNRDVYLTVVLSSIFLPVLPLLPLPFFLFLICWN